MRYATGRDRVVPCRTFNASSQCSQRPSAHPHTVLSDLHTPPVATPLSPRQYKHSSRCPRKVRVPFLSSPMSLISVLPHQLVWPSILFPCSSNAFRFCRARSLAFAPAPSLFSGGHLYSLNTPSLPCVSVYFVSSKTISIFRSKPYTIFFSRSWI